MCPALPAQPHLAATLGAAWTSLAVEDYIQRAADAPADAVEATVAQYRAAYALADDLTPADLAATARAELALRGMVTEHRLDALSFQFMAFGEDERTVTLPFVAASRLMADGVGFAGFRRRGCVRRQARRWLGLSARSGAKNRRAIGGAVLPGGADDRLRRACAGGGRCSEHPPRCNPRAGRI